MTNRLVKALKHRCDGVIAVSESVAADIRHELGASLRGARDLERGRSRTIRSRRSTPRSRHARRAAAGRFDAAADRSGRDVCAVEGSQGVSRDAEGAEPLHPFRVYIVGGPLYETQDSQVSMDELRTAIDRLGLTGSVGLTGFVKDAAAALRALDIVVHASTSPEPFGLVIAEAMAAGRCVVISDSGGVAELVKDHETGLTYRAGDVQQMTEQVRTLLDDPGLTTRIGQAAHTAAGVQFDQQRMSRQLLDVYAQVGSRSDVVPALGAA